MLELSKRRGYPVYLQIKEQIERRIASGVLAPGQPLPSVRSLARSLAINPNTVVRAYRELETLALIESRHGEGTFVTKGAHRGQPASRLLSDRARVYVRAARELGVDGKTATDTVAREWKKEKKS